MKVKDFIKLGKQLLPLLPGFVVNRSLIFRYPIGDTLQGLWFDRSADANCFYLSTFLLPLYVPREFFGVSHGNRIGHAVNWRADNPNLSVDISEAVCHEAIPFLDTISTADGLLNYLKMEVDNKKPHVNSNQLEDLAYALIMNGDYTAALEALAEQRQRLENSTIDWVVEQRNRAQLMEEKLLNSPEIALEQLDVWKAETIRNLGLEKYC